MFAALVPLEAGSPITHHGCLFHTGTPVGQGGGKRRGVTRPPAAPIQMRVKISVPRAQSTRPFGPTVRAVQVTLALPWSRACPDQTTVGVHNPDVHLGEVVNVT